MMPPADTPKNQDTRKINVVETGVAAEYEAMKKISCGDLEWHVRWKSTSSRGPIMGDVKLLSGAISKILPDAQSQIFDKFATVDNVSATCNMGADGQPVRSTLLILGNGFEDGKKSLAQGNIEPGMAVNWTFSTVE
jgi:hypothetical protein